MGIVWAYSLELYNEFIRLHRELKTRIFNLEQQGGEEALLQDLRGHDQFLNDLLTTSSQMLVTGFYTREE